MAVVQPKIWGPMDTAARSHVDWDTLTMLPNGGYVVTWRDNEKIAFQIYDGNGARVGDKKFVDDSGIPQFRPDAVSYTADGRFVITWTEQVGTSSGRILRMQTFEVDGSAGDATTLNGAHDGTQMAANANGGWATVYVDDTNWVRLVQFDQTGAAGTAIGISSATGVNLPDVTWLGGSKYAVSYLTADGSSVRIVDASNGNVSSATNIPEKAEAKIAALIGTNGEPSGRFVIVSNDSQGAPIVARTYATDENGAVTLVRTTTISPPQDPGLPGEGTKISVTALRDGSYAVAYVSRSSGNPDIWVKVVDADGQEGPAFNVSALSGEQVTPAIFEMADGRLAVSWHDRSHPTHGSGIETRIVDARAAKIKVTGTNGDDIHAPSAHVGDTLDGGAGIDTLTFKGAGAGVALDLGAESGTAGDAAGDIYRNFENVIGSAFNDTITSSAAANLIEGGAGNDILNGAAGADTMRGGTGADTYYVDNLADRIEESTAGDIDLVYTSVSHTLESYVENMIAIGGAGAINLTGNA